METTNLHKQNRDEYESFERAYPALNLTARFKSIAEDFVVEENMAIDFSGEGEHCWVYIKKQGCNTDWVAQQIARFCDVKKVAVSYAGLKDRHAVTSQWFSVQLPGLPSPDWSEFEYAFNEKAATGVEAGAAVQEKIQVLQSFRHNKKLQRGALKSNSFTITLRELSECSDEMFEILQQRCAEISDKGVPNYFGEQRFGLGSGNLQQAEKMFARPRLRLSRHKRSLYLSAARSWLFNSILSARVKQHVWDKRLAGDVFMLSGKSACFKDEAGEHGSAAEMDDSETRLARKEIHPTAVLWGKGDTMVRDEAAELESRIIDLFPLFRDGLIAAGLEAQRRACRVIPEQMSCKRDHDNFVVSFRLPAGSYATMVLDEIFSELQTSA